LGDEDWMVMETRSARAVELENPDFALESYMDPKVQATHVVVIILAETELARVKRRAFPDSQA